MPPTNKSYLIQQFLFDPFIWGRGEYSNVPLVLIYPQSSGIPITLTAQAIGSGTIYYKFWYKDDSGWHVIKDWSTDNSATWTPNQAGTYTIVVWANTTADDNIPNRPIAGLTCTVEE